MSEKKFGRKDQVGADRNTNHTSFGRKDTVHAEKKAYGQNESIRRSARDSSFRANGSRENGRRMITSVKTSNDLSKTPRYIAYLVLEDVLYKDTYASMALDERFENKGLSQADKRLSSSILYSTLEHLYLIDHILAQFIPKPESLSQQIRDILRISVSQIFFHDRIPENAIVDEAVKLTRFIGLEPLTGLVNGVLRSILRGKENIKYPRREDGVEDYLSVMYSIPKFVAEKLVSGYGEEEAIKICAFRRERHFVTLRRNMSLFPNDETFEKAVLSKKVWNWEKSQLSGSYRVYGISDLSRDAGYLSGHFSVQGEGSTISAMSLGAAPGMKVLDCCAAPGGKTAYIAEQMNGTGRIYAWDVHDHRVALIRAMQSRLHFENIRPAVRDALHVKDDLVGAMDAVMLDAPCTGIGVMDSKPDIRLRVSEESIDELCELQEKLMDTCCAYVRRGGTFVYSTCSVLPEENTLRVKKFLEKHTEFHISPLPECIPERFRKHNSENGLQLLSYRDDTEGFFVARMTRDK